MSGQPKAGPILLCYDGSESSARAIAAAGALAIRGPALVCHTYAGHVRAGVPGNHGPRSSSAGRRHREDRSDATREAASQACRGGRRPGPRRGLRRGAPPRQGERQDVEGDHRDRRPSAGGPDGRGCPRCLGDRPGAPRQRVELGAHPLAGRRCSWCPTPRRTLCPTGRCSSATTDRSTHCGRSGPRASFSRVVVRWCSPSGNRWPRAPRRWPDREGSRPAWRPRWTTSDRSRAGGTPPRARPPRRRPGSRPNRCRRRRSPARSGET